MSLHETLSHFLTAGTVLAFKVTVLVVGYKIARLGHDLLLKGISGGFKFSGGYAGIKGDLISSSPGLLFLLLGVVLLCVGVWKDAQFATTSNGSRSSGATADQAEDSGGVLPVTPAGPTNTSSTEDSGFTTEGNFGRLSPGATHGSSEDWPNNPLRYVWRALDAKQREELWEMLSPETQQEFRGLEPQAGDPEPASGVR